MMRHYSSKLIPLEYMGAFNYIFNGTNMLDPYFIYLTMHSKCEEINATTGIKNKFKEGTLQPRPCRNRRASRESCGNQ